jgi:hypothetical protein
MRMLLKVTIPTTSGNKSIAEGKLPGVISRTLEELKPEAAYFTAWHGNRTALLFFDLKDATLMPSLVEPLFAGLDAEIDLVPVMNAAELKEGLGKVVPKK